MPQIFDATNIPPQQGGAKHPVGNKFPFTITDTQKKDVKDNNQGNAYFEVTFTSPAGSIKHNYNMWNASKTAVEIAAKQLSALCHAVGVFKVDLENGMALRNAKGLMDIGFQAGQEPSAEKPEGGYVELKRIYDINGNEPGKPVQQSQAQPNQQPQPNQPQVQTGWGNGAATANQSQANANSNANNQPGGWQQGNQPNAEKPPWG